MTVFGLLKWLGGLIKDRLGTIIVAIFLAPVAVIPGACEKRVETVLNRPQLRMERYRELAHDLGSFAFQSELIEEFLSKGWTTKEGLSPIIVDYNKAITGLRTNQYAYETLLARYWSEDSRLEFAEIMTTAREIDERIHELNDEFEQVNVLKKKERIDAERASDTANALRPLLARLSEGLRRLTDQTL